MARWGSFCIRWGSLGAHGGSRWAGSPPKLPYIGDPDVEYPYVVFPYIEIPYLEISSIEIPYIEIPYVEIPYIDIPCVDFPYPHLTHKAQPKAKAKAKPKPKPKPKAKQKATPKAKAKAKAKGLIVLSGELLFSNSLFLRSTPLAPRQGLFGNITNRQRRTTIHNPANCSIAFNNLFIHPFVVLQIE